jgi:alpha-1,3-glucosyltransferase
VNKLQGDDIQSIHIQYYFDLLNMKNDISARRYPKFLSNHPERSILPPLFIISICIKILLFPTYRSTDFDVHRNWLAITHQLPLSEWYFDDVNGTTVHTLDYPPNFAYFEWTLANNPMTQMILPEHDRCLQLLPDSDNDPSDACVAFQRSTVILSDLVLWIGAYIACHAMHHKSIGKATISFLLIVFNPGLLWLDHIHFQYNGMMLGILLASLGLLMRGNNSTADSPSYHFCHLGGAALYAILVNFKHLYLPLGPLYLFYLLKTYCLDSSSGSNRLLMDRFLMLATITGGTLLVPWIPFLLQENPKEQILQILSRLFPFGRGLVHDYWAANVWALYLLADKVVQFLSGRTSLLPLYHLPEPSPAHCALLLLVSLLPGLYLVWTRPNNNTKLIQAVVYCSLCAFMLAYHVHEKAILTALVPMTLLIEHDAIQNFLFSQVSIFGLLGLFPLLFQPVELAFKLVSYVLYLAMCSSFLSAPSPLWVQRVQYLSYFLVLATVTLLEFIPIQGRWEFLPLMVTSAVCALALVPSWVAVLYKSYTGS